MVELKLKLPEHFLEEEVREDYTVPAKMKEVWAVQLDLLAELMRVCEAHGIQYYADAGTLLGAVRHRGYIPWDDDLDVMMMRPDYEKLCASAPGEFRDPYFFQTQETEPGTLREHAQLRNSMTSGIRESEARWRLPFNQGIFLDIFPIDNVPDDDQDFLLQCRTADTLIRKARTRALYKDRYVKDSPNPLRKAAKAAAHAVLAGPLRKVDFYEKYYRDYIREVTKYDGQPTKRVAKYFNGLMTEKDRRRRVWERSWFDTTVMLPFEMMEIPAPGGYLELLDRFYGDWKTPVRGTATHGGVIYDTSRSYKEYLRDE